MEHALSQSLLYLWSTRFLSLCFICSDVSTPTQCSQSVCISSFLGHCSGLLTGLLATSLGLTESILLSVTVVQSLSYNRLFATPWTAMLGFPVFTVSLVKLMSIESMMPSNHLILCLPLLLLPSISPSIRVFSSELALHVSRGNEYSGLISFRIDWLDILAVQGTLKSLLQHHNSKASVVWCSAFFMVQGVTGLFFSYCAGSPTGNYVFRLRISLHKPYEYWSLTCSGI